MLVEEDEYGDEFEIAETPNTKIKRERILSLAKSENKLKIKKVKGSFNSISSDRKMKESLSSIDAKKLL